MFNFLCKVFGHRFKYIRRYYRCTRCGVRRCDLFARETNFVSKSMTEMVANARDVWEHNGLSVRDIPAKEIK